MCPTRRRPPLRRGGVLARRCGALDRFWFAWMGRPAPPWKWLRWNGSVGASRICHPAVGGDRYEAQLGTCRIDQCPPGEASRPRAARGETKPRARRCAHLWLCMFACMLECDGLQRPANSSIASHNNRWPKRGAQDRLGLHAGNVPIILRHSRQMSRTSAPGTTCS